MLYKDGGLSRDINTKSMHCMSAYAKNGGCAHKKTTELIENEHLCDVIHWPVSFVCSVDAIDVVRSRKEMEVFNDLNVVCC